MNTNGPAVILQKMNSLPIVLMKFKKSEGLDKRAGIDAERT